MKVAYIFLLCILGATLLSPVLCNHSKEPDECCFEFFSNPIRRNLISSYYETDSRCSKKAVVLITKRYRHICVEPGKDWVEKIVKFLQRKSL
ncbi:PREDICTED: C-C motif chemokine 3-like [Cyprinodon variegatus]|uniref:C-C motif chemokine n=1 Tax=Cyprinodon variegatus TaxID=28743 RepID=A0A3Q2FWB0_CYPVA|nr:PREDICTED: C-C motif chemokine 3-like [Cyprinodon variegatus]